MPAPAGAARLIALAIAAAHRLPRAFRHSGSQSLLVAADRCSNCSLITVAMLAPCALHTRGCKEAYQQQGRQGFSNPTRHRTLHLAREGAAPSAPMEGQTGRHKAYPSLVAIPLT
mmetsp:Transcript_1369/g.1270  ORF Transcript_1369/g.1270 Transcript_1369/m.1270 type:complete len:115 (+) Transcript_1369:1034-1378(+)